jgi:hypothetical protein
MGYASREQNYENLPAPARYRQRRIDIFLQSASSAEQYRGCRHRRRRDRPLEIYGGKTTIHLGGGRENFVLLPIIPPRPVAKPAKKTAKRRPKPKRRR